MPVTSEEARFDFARERCDEEGGDGGGRDAASEARRESSRLEWVLLELGIRAENWCGDCCCGGDECTDCCWERWDGERCEERRELPTQDILSLGTTVSVSFPVSCSEEDW